MFDLFNYNPPPTQKVAAYAQWLMGRFGELRILPRREVKVGDWSPQLNRCHDNVATWLSHTPSDVGVVGWLVVDYRPTLPWVRFTAHTVVAINNSDEWIDITPSIATQDYPFVSSGLQGDAFFALEKILIESFGSSQFDWIPE